MSKRVTRLREALDALDVIEGFVGQASQKISDVIVNVREKIDAQYQQASANDAYETEAERRAQATAQAVVGLFSKVTDNQSLKNFFDVVINPAHDAGTAEDIEFPWDSVTDPVDSNQADDLDQKIKFVKDYYRTRFGMNVWQSPGISETMVNSVYDFIKSKDND
jgi:hypothetical protein